MNNIVIREYKESDIKAMVEIWNEVVEDGVAFPQIDGLTEESGKEFFAQQSYCGVAEDEETNTVLGMYILHPNKWLDFTFFIRIILADVVIFPMPAMQYLQSVEDYILARNW